MGIGQTLFGWVVGAGAASVAFMAMGYQRATPAAPDAAFSATPYQSENAAEVVVRMYDVHALLHEEIGLTAEQFDKQFNPYMPIDSASARASIDDESRVEELRKLITDMIDSDSWEVNGGEIGRTGYCAPGMLIMIHTPRVQAKIEHLLRLLNGEP